jgi:hypothetical protein
VNSTTAVPASSRPRAQRCARCRRALRIHRQRSRPAHRPIP